MGEVGRGPGQFSLYWHHSRKQLKGLQQTTDEIGFMGHKKIPLTALDDFSG